MKLKSHKKNTLISKKLSKKQKLLSTKNRKYEFEKKNKFWGEQKLFFWFQKFFGGDIQKKSKCETYELTFTIPTSITYSWGA